MQLDEQSESKTAACIGIGNSVTIAPLGGTSGGTADTNSRDAFVAETEAFFRDILPIRGYKVLVDFRAGSNPIHRFYGSHEEAAEWALRLNAQGSTVYHGCATYLSNNNRKASNAGWMRSFWVDADVDPTNPAKYPTLQGAIEDLGRVCRTLKLPLPTLVASGGGLHGYWTLDEDIGAPLWKTVADDIKAILEHLHFRQDRSRTADAASILRPVGTTWRKQGERRVRLIHRAVPISLGLMMERLKQYSSAYIGGLESAPSTAPIVPIASSPTSGASPSLDTIRALVQWASQKYPRLWAGDWQDPDDDLRGGVGYPSQSEADYALLGHLVREAVHRGIALESIPATVFESFGHSGLYRPEKQRQVQQYAIPKLLADALQGGVAAVPSAEDLGFGTPGDILAGRLFAWHWRGKYLYATHRGVWLRWDGVRWIWCTTEEHMAAAKMVADKILERATGLYKQNPDRYKPHMTFALRLQNLPRLEAMVTLARSETDMAVGSMTELDADPWLVGVRNDVVNLKDGTLLQAEPKMLITRQANVDYDPDAECPQWMRFLGQIFKGDLETIEYIQRALGYTLTGVTSEEVLFVCHGHGANGKSVFANVISRILNDYAQAAPSTLLTVRRADDASPRNDIARLCGVRLTLINELGQGDRLDEQVVKWLAGREQMSARYLHREFFDFWPTAKCWLRTNHRPVITGDDDGIWRRIHLIPFRRKFEGHERDPKLEEKLMHESAGIFAWMVRGCLEWQRIGLKPSRTVRAESAIYRKESDLLGEFLEDETHADSDAKVSQQTLFWKWEMWCKENGVNAGSKKSFTRKLAERGFSASHSGGKRFYDGLREKPRELPDDAKQVARRLRLTKDGGQHGQD
jgi:P4 family phage/plasmid primase-like protien